MKESLYKEGRKTGVEEEDIPKEDAQEKTFVRQEMGPYLRYKKLGGIINEKDFENARRRTIETATISDATMAKIEVIEKVAGIIELKKTEDAIDTVKLWAVLRSDNKPEDVKDHHAQMGDARLFAEVLRMQGDTDALEKLITAYHKVGIHCPICLNKKVAPGEECH